MGRQPLVLSVTLYISSGRQNKMYTLRQYTTYDDDYPKSEYIGPLSTDWDTAVEKAKAISVKMGTPLNVHLGFDLEKITRSTPEELAERKEQQRKDEERKLAAIQEQRRQNQMIGNAKTEFFFGKHEGKTPEEVFACDPDYTKWLMKQVVEEPTSASHFFLIKVQNLYAHLMNGREELVSNYVGKIGDKIEVEVLCTKETGYQSDFGWVCLYICQDSDGNVFKLKYSGSKWYMDQHQRYLISGTVKSHDEYNEVKQTSLGRVKLLEKL